jgi:hypothetical protein
VLTGREFFPALISAPFHHGLVVVFVAAASLATVAAFASLLRGGRAVPPEPGPQQAAEVPAEGMSTPAEGTKASSLPHRRDGPVGQVGRRTIGRSGGSAPSCLPLVGLHPAQPKRECAQAMSSVWMTTDPGTSPPIRAASVVLPLLLRPSMASTAGRPELPWSGLRLVTALTTVLSNSTRHGPASGSS